MTPTVRFNKEHRDDLNKLIFATPTTPQPNTAKYSENLANLKIFPSKPFYTVVSVRPDTMKDGSYV